MSMTPQQLTNLLVLGDYPDDEIRKVLLDKFPEQDPDALIAHGREHLARVDAELAEGEAREAEAARQAEHDTTRSMHTEQEEPK